MEPNRHPGKSGTPQRKFRVEMLLALAGTALALLIGYEVIKRFRPQLFQAPVPVDMQIVQESRTVPAFYRFVLPDASDQRGADIVIPDPMIGVRNLPLQPARTARGPHDLLGFRNSAVPNKVDVLAVGDSQTYGNNALRQHAWPAELGALLPNRSVYQAAVGGWSAPHYALIVERMLTLYPSTIVVAFYMGNDVAEAFRASRLIERFRKYIKHEALGLEALPSYPFPPPPADSWHVMLKDNEGIERSIELTPKLRWVSNDRSLPSIREGIEIIKDAMARIVQITSAPNIPVVFVLIPTKETAFEMSLRSAGVELREDYQILVDHESKTRSELVAYAREEFGSLSDAATARVKTVDCTAPLQSAVRASPTRVYPNEADGHPMADGYRVIAECVAPFVSASSSLQLADGLYQAGPPENAILYLVKNGAISVFYSPEAATRRGYDLKTARTLPDWTGRNTDLNEILY